VLLLKLYSAENANCAVLTLLKMLSEAQSTTYNFSRILAGSRDLLQYAPPFPYCATTT